MTPGCAEANGASRTIHANCKKECKNGRKERGGTVRSYKATPRPATGYSPNYLMFGRELKGKLPSKTEKGNNKDTYWNTDSYLKITTMFCLGGHKDTTTSSSLQTPLRMVGADFSVTPPYL